MIRFAEFGVPRLGTNPKLRAVALLQAGSMRWKAAALGGYHDGENALADQLQGALRPGQLCLADRGSSTTKGSKLFLEACDGDAGEIWGVG